MANDEPVRRFNRWARRIQAIAQNGLTYTEGAYDRERYEELTEIALEMLGAACDASPAELRGRLHLESGYVTPKVDVRGVVFSEGRILLVREAEDGLWTLPGGWADGGDTPAGAVEREIREESGYEARAVKLLGLYDRDNQGHPPLPWYVYKLFILCDLVGGEARTSLETTDVGFFGPDELPPLSTGRVLEHQIHRAFEHRSEPGLPTDFD